MSVGELIEFLSQFSTDAEIAFCLFGQDKFDSVEVFVEPSGEKDFPPYPLIVLDWI